MLYALIKDNRVAAFPYTIDQLKADHANVSFPNPINQNILSLYGMEPVVEYEIPEVDSLTQSFSWGQPELRDGRWHQTWQVQQLSTEVASERVRDRRNQLLVASDWTQVADAPVNREAWAEYRAELRDLPNQAGFPFQVAWPAPPNS